MNANGNINTPNREILFRLFDRTVFQVCCSEPKFFRNRFVTKVFAGRSLKIGNISVQSINTRPAAAMTGITKDTDVESIENKTK